MSFPGRALQRAWHLVDAKNQTVGRLAAQIAPILKGKHKPTFMPNKDMGDYVVIVNAEKVRTVEGGKPPNSLFSVLSWNLLL
jgi:large subunit ribosomal protein L13